MIFEQEITWGKHTLLLTNKRALFWPAKKTLILSDLHLGKAAHFRRNGIPIPSQIHHKDLDILEKLLLHYQVERVIIVGDLIHANQNSEVLDFKEFLLRHKGIEFILIRGNHDRLVERKILNLGISAIYDCYELDGMQFVHEPTPCEISQISGHIHPGVTVRLPTNKHFRLPAYVVSEDMIILPAFSQFTGLDTKPILEKAVKYAILDTGIVVIK